MYSIRSVQFMILSALLAVTFTCPVAASGQITQTATQTIRSLSQNQNGIRGDYFVSYSSLTLRSADWSLRGSVSWLSWRDGGGSASIPDDSGLGSAFITGSRRLWRSHGRSGNGSGWLRLRAKIPLQSGFDATGSGEFDTGASLFSAYRFGAWSILGELGIMNLGEPVGFQYDALFNGSFSVSYRRYGSRIYPLIGYSISSAAQAGDPAYEEWSFGFGAFIARDASVSALYSIGTTEISPESGIALSVSLRL